MHLGGSHKKIKHVIAALLLIIVFSAGIVIGGYYGENKGSGEVTNKDAEESTYLGQDVDFRMFWQVWNILKESYYRQPVSETKLFYGALAGMVDSLDDPYTVFFTPTRADEFDEELEGRFEGIGAEIGIKHDVLTIIAPLPNSPAEKAGLHSGDLVLAIDGEDTTGIYIEDAVMKIRGEAGTDVVLTIYREGDEATQDISITRGKIDMVSVRTTIREDNIAYVEIFSFAEDTVDLFDEGVDEILDANVDGIILDLRGNSGGYLEAAVYVASRWTGKQVVTIEKDSKSEESNYYGQGKASLENIPTVVLINQGTASGSEIVAGALGDYDMAETVGMPSFGKGSVQQMEKLKDGSAVKITVAEWLTPNGTSFNEAGLVPDYEIEMAGDDYNEDRDPQLDKALELLSGVVN